MCSEITAQGGSVPDWRLLTEDELLYEAAHLHLRQPDAVRVGRSALQTGCGIVACCIRRSLRDGGLRNVILDALSEPLPLTEKMVVWPGAGTVSKRLASLLTTTVAGFMYGYSLRRLRFSADGAKGCAQGFDVERLGVRAKTGKPLLAASWILCRPCSAGRPRTRLSPPDARTPGYTEPARTPVLYEEIEDTFREVASPIWSLAGCVDLRLGLTMRVAKREAYL